MQVVQSPSLESVVTVFGVLWQWRFSFERGGDTARASTVGSMAWLPPLYTRVAKIPAKTIQFLNYGVHTENF